MTACNCDTFDRSVVITAASSASIDPLTLTVVNDYGDNRRARLYLGTSHPVAGSIQGQPLIQIGAAQGDKAQQRLRREAGLAPFAWTDHPAIPRETPIRALHFLELRRAIEQVRRLRGLGRLPMWTAGSPPSSERMVFATDVNDLRGWLARS